MRRNFGNLTDLGVKNGKKFIKHTKKYECHRDKRIWKS